MPIPPCRCGASKDKEWHLVCSTCWARIPTPLQDEVLAAYKARCGHWNETARVQRHWAAMKACMKALGPPEQARAMRLLSEAPVAFGLRAQGHLPTIVDMLARGCSWDEIGKRIAWDPATARGWYERETQAPARKLAVPVLNGPTIAPRLA